MKIKNLIKELEKFDKNLDIKLYPKYVVDKDTYRRHNIKKTFFCPCENEKNEKWIEIRF